MNREPDRLVTHRCILFLLMLLSASTHALKRPMVQESKAFDLTRLPASRFRAVTVLHKPCSTLGYTLTNFASNLGPEWPLLVLHNDDVSPSLERNKIVQLQKKHGLLRTVSLESNGFHKLSSSNSSSYSKLLASTRFWSSLKAEHVLLFQMDSVLCSMSPWSINDFLHYDFIGAPWIDRWYGMDIGNGGLSLRKTKTMIRITKTFKFETENEDIYFARGIYKLAEKDSTIKIPPMHVAAKFAYEAGRLPRVASFGVHKTPFREVDTEAIVATCPEAMAGVWRGCRVELYEETTVALSTRAKMASDKETEPEKTASAKAAIRIKEKKSETAVSAAETSSSATKTAHAGLLIAGPSQVIVTTGDRFLAAARLATNMLDFESDYRV